MSLPKDHTPEPSQTPMTPAERGIAVQDLQRNAASIVNTSRSASSYAGLKDSFEAGASQSNFKNRVSGVLVSGLSSTPRVKEDGTVEMQDANTYNAKYELMRPEKLQSDATTLLRDPDPVKKGEGLVLMVDAPLARSVQNLTNPSLRPSMVVNNARTPDAVAFAGINKTSPYGDPSTGRPIPAQVWMMSDAGGLVPVHGFQKGQGAKASFMGVRPGVDELGNTTVSLVSSVEFEPGITEIGTREIKRDKIIESAPKLAETPEQQRELLDNLAAEGWQPITRLPPDKADQPEAFRGFSEADVTARAIMRLADSVRQHNVITLATSGADLTKLPDEPRTYAQDFAKLAASLEGAGYPRKGVDHLLNLANGPLVKLSELRESVDRIRKDPAAMDPITEIRVKATELLKLKGKKPEDIYPILDEPGESFTNSLNKAMGEDAASSFRGRFQAADNERMAVLEQMAKDLTDTLGAWATPAGKQWEKDGVPLTFPDGSPRRDTPFDDALDRGGNHYNEVRTGYRELQQAVMDATAGFIGARLRQAPPMAGSSEAGARKPGEIAADYVNHKYTGTPMDAKEKAFVERVLKSSSGKSAFMDELTSLYGDAVMASAHRLRLSPAEVQRDLVAKAEDFEPWDVAVKSFRVRQFGSMPDPSQQAYFITPEQELPKGFNPANADQVRQIAADRTWQVTQFQTEQGSLVPRVFKSGMSTADMLDLRHDATMRHIPQHLSRQPLSEHMDLPNGIAKSFNLPVTNSHDPVTGEAGRYAFLGVKVQSEGLGSSVLPGNYKALNFSKDPMVYSKEIVQIPDERGFLSSVGGVEKAKALIDKHPEAEKLRAALDEMARPRRANGVYEIKTTTAGLSEFAKKREGAVQAMGAVLEAKAKRDFEMDAKGKPADRRGELETRRDSTIAQVQESTAARMRDIPNRVAAMDEFIRTYGGKKGYFGFAPPLGQGNNDLKIRKTPMEFRFQIEEGGGDLNRRLASLARKGHAIHPDAFRVD